MPSSLARKNRRAARKSARMNEKTHKRIRKELNKLLVVTERLSPLGLVQEELEVLPSTSEPPSVASEVEQAELTNIDSNEEVECFPGALRIAAPLNCSTIFIDLDLPPLDKLSIPSEWIETELSAMGRRNVAQASVEGLELKLNQVLEYRNGSMTHRLEIPPATVHFRLVVLSDEKDDDGFSLNAEIERVSMKMERWQLESFRSD